LIKKRIIINKSIINNDKNNAYIEKSKSNIKIILSEEKKNNKENNQTNFLHDIIHRTKFNLLLESFNPERKWNIISSRSLDPKNFLGNSIKKKLSINKYL
jgi:hypothetical protein